MSGARAVLELEQARLRARLGWDDGERAKPQAVDLGVRIEFAVPPEACASDALRDTICYAELLERAQKRCDEREYRLIEHLAQDLLTTLRPELPRNAAVELRVDKPHVPHPALSRGSVSFTLRSEAGTETEIEPVSGETQGESAKSPREGASS